MLMCVTNKRFNIIALPQKKKYLIEETI